jgi:hypothetical protein
MNDVIVFRSDAFSLDNTIVDGREADLPLGIDLAILLRDRLMQLQPTLSIDEPVWEDWGTVLRVKERNDQYYIAAQWTYNEPHENTWAITFWKPRGLIGLLLMRPAGPEQCRSMQRLVAQIVADDPTTFNSPQWMSQAQYDAAH